MLRNSSFNQHDLPASCWGTHNVVEGQRDPGTPLSDPVLVIEAVDQNDVMVASPSIVKLESGRLLIVHEVVPRHTVSDEASWKRVRAPCMS